jgi:hypothetical protein
MGKSAVTRPAADRGAFAIVMGSFAVVGLVSVGVIAGLSAVHGDRVLAAIAVGLACLLGSCR